jgi:hypothetical protein
MSFIDHVKILKQGVKTWNKWREDNPDIIPQLSKIDFGDEFSFTPSLEGINLSSAYLESSNLFSLTLDSANLERAHLQNVNCYGASFKNVNFNSANLELVNFCLADLDGADFKESYLGSTIFGFTDLSTAKNLDSCIHLGSSIVDNNTLSKSMNLPLKFLRGCGLPDFIIDNISVLQNDPIMFYSCFISYSSKDHEFAERLYSDLQNKGIRCWFAPEDMKGGKKSYDQINDAIRLHDKLLLVLSENSITSDWVATEIKKARRREKREKRQVLFPISIVNHDTLKNWELFDADLGSDLAEEVRSYHIPDFTNWKNHDSYEGALKKLIADLKNNK